MTSPTSTTLSLQTVSSGFVPGTPVTVALDSTAANPINITGNAAADGTGTVFLECTAAYATGSAAAAPGFTATYLTAISFSGGATPTFSTSSLTYFNTVSGIALASKPVNLTGNAQLVLVRTGSTDPGTSATTQYAQPTYMVLDHQLRVVTRFFEGQAPADPYLGVSSSGNSKKTAQMLPSVTVLSNPNQASLLEAIFPMWRAVVEGFNPGVVATNVTVQLPSTSSTVAATTILLPQLIVSNGPPNIIQYQSSVAVLSVPSSLALSPGVTLGRSQLISGSLSMTYDGREVVESGWHNAPHTPTLNGQTATAGSTISAGGYMYTAIYRWSDANGQIHRSAPSTPFFVNQSTTFSAQYIAVPLPLDTYRGDYQNPSATGGNPSVELYRSDSGGTAYYLVANSLYSNGVNPVHKAPSSTTASAFYVSFSDSQPNSTSASFGTAFPLYTSAIAGSHFESSPAPSFIWSVAVNGRVFGLASIDGTYRVYYTCQSQGGIIPEWNVGAYYPIPPDLGDCRSIAALDDKIVVFGSRGIGYFNGTGPSTQSGSNGIDQDPASGFNAFTVIPNSSGVIGSGSPVTIPSGVMYQGLQGFSLLGRDLTIDGTVGDPVDPLSGYYGVTGNNYGIGALLPGLQGVVWANPSGDSLFFDYGQKKWSVWQASVVGPIASIVQRQDGTIYAAQQKVSGSSLPTTFTLNGASINNGISVLFGQAGTLSTPTSFSLPTMQVESPWIPLGAGPQGEGDVWEAVILGNYFSPHILQIETAVNYGPYGVNGFQTANAPVQFTVSADPAPYQFRVRTPGGSRAWAVRYRITILAPTSTIVSPISDFARITGLMLFGGAEHGLTRMGFGVSR